jgi:hypothetical protein
MGQPQGGGRTFQAKGNWKVMRLKGNGYWYCDMVGKINAAQSLKCI